MIKVVKIAKVKKNLFLIIEFDKSVYVCRIHTIVHE